MASDRPDGTPPPGGTVTDSVQLDPTPALQLDRGAKFGRYIILERLGAGGMGVVYSAYDPELDRKIALKILRPEQVGDQSRLRREAQAMARLQHPNVIAVHDVGLFQERVFVAMELIDGETLSRWLAERPRDWRAITDCFRQAGSGLMAAHAVELVHRDFTLANVLVGRDGRVRVGDFGLARAVGASSDESEGMSPDSPSPSLHETITRPGALMGTPTYLAPEQFAGKGADPRSDQFSFCVAFYRALYGVKPFAGDEVKQIAAAVTAGQLRPPPKDTRVPGWVRDIVLRGLATNPDARWPSMQRLLDALADDPSRRGRRRGAAIGALVMLAALVVGARALERRHNLVCAGAERKLSGIWDDARKNAVRTAFAATNKPFAADAFANVAQTLDRYAARWTAMHTEACLATRERREQSEELLDLRMECLDQRLQEANAKIDLFTRADEAIVQRAASMASSLAPISTCADIAALRAPVRPPADPELHARVVALRNEVEKQRALSLAGKYPEAVAQGLKNAAAAHTLGYLPLESYALYQLAWVQRKLSQPDAAAKNLDDAVIAARAGRDAAAEANAWSLLVKVADKRGQYNEAHLYARHAYAAIAALGSSDERPLLSVLESLGSVLYSEGKVDEALDYAHRGLAISTKLYGPESTNTAFWLSSLARTLTAQGRYAEAEPEARRALAIYTKLLGPNHPELPDSMLVLAQVLYEEGRFAESLDYCQRAAALWERTIGPDVLRLHEALFSAGEALTALGRYDEALPLERRSVAIAEKRLGPTNALVALPLNTLGKTLALRGDSDEAVATWERAMAIIEKQQGRDHIYLIDGLNGIALVHLDRHEPGKALPLLERANAIFAAHPSAGDPLDKARTRFGLARASTELGRGGDAAHALAVQARADAVTAGRKGERQLAAIDTWLAAHPKT